MTIKKNTLKLIGFLLILNIALANAQQTKVYKIDDLLNRIHNNTDTTYVVNFWATWCKPCVAELPEFEKLNENFKADKVKVILVSMDFKDELTKRLKVFLEKNKYGSEVVLLDEVNGNDFINKISTTWSGAIPATLITRKNKALDLFFEKKVTYDFLVEHIK
jgi:thiol-disulfide isomerase/thioredoxin